MSKLIIPKRLQKKYQAQEAMNQARTDAEQLELNKQKLQANTLIQKDRIDTTEEIANMRAQNARFLASQRNN